MKTKLRSRLPLLLILLSGTALRLFHLGADSLWYDETVSTTLAGSPLPELLRHTAGDIHPPLYYVLLRGWLICAGYPTGHADPTGYGLEFTSGFFSLFFGVLLLALIYILARRVANRRVAWVASAFAAVSPYNIWYSQEVRMYTLGAALGVVTLYALLRATRREREDPPRAEASRLRGGLWWWLVYAVAAAAGMYTLYYFAFLLVPLNLWALAALLRRPRFISRIAPWLLANLAAAALYAPWIPIAFRQATHPPVPPWRTTPDLWVALRESWQALSLGQSAPGWLWPVLLLTLGLYGLGMLALFALWASPAPRPRGPMGVSHSLAFPVATFGATVLILIVSLVTPLYHVRYVFTYSPAFYVVMAAGVAWLWGRKRLAAGIAAACWLAAAGITLHAFWFDPSFRADDHRAAVRFLRSQWRPGDVLVVNAGYAYPPLTTYWDGTVASRSRITDLLPAPRDDDALVLVTTGHVDGDPGLGWADPRSDFFAMPSEVAQQQIPALFNTFDRVWHYRIYDTVNDRDGLVRSLLDEQGHMIDERGFPGEAFMRVQGFIPRREAAWEADTCTDPQVRCAPTYRYAVGVTVQEGSLPETVEAGQTLYSGLTWRADVTPSAGVATSLRLVGPDGDTWAQPRDERPLGPLFPVTLWRTGQAYRQPIAVPVPEGTPPGRYTLALLVYNPATGTPWPPQGASERPVAVPDGLNLGQVEVVRPSGGGGEGAPALRHSLARFGPISLVEASSPATVVSPGSAVPVELLWQAAEAPEGPLVVVVQLLGSGDRLVANLEEEPVKGLYPTGSWTAGELVRDRHTLGVPPDVAPGPYRLVVGVYRAADRVRLETRAWPFGKSSYRVIQTVQVVQP